MEIYEIKKICSDYGNERVIGIIKYYNKILKETIELMLQLDDDKNYSLSDIERDKYVKMLKRLE